jgi:hypothetical protein
MGLARLQPGSGTQMVDLQSTVEPRVHGWLGTKIRRPFYEEVGPMYWLLMERRVMELVAQGGYDVL